MQDIFRKYFWVLGVVAVLVCSVLAAKTVNHVVEGKFLSDSAEAAKPITKRQARRPAPVQRRSKVGMPIATRNVFCSTCEPETPEAPIAGGSDPSGSVPISSLPLQLVATNVSSVESGSFATIRNTTSESQGAYWVGQSIPEAGKVVVIAGKYIDFENEKTRRRERLSLVDQRAPTVAKATPPKPTRPTPSRNEKKDEMAALIDEGVKKVDDFTYEIDSSLREKVLSNPMAVARGARIVPSVKNGKANGFKLYAIRPSSVYSKIGFRNGDTIHSINGYDMTSPDKALEVYTKLKDADNLSVSITRRGKAATLNYTVR